MKVLSLIFLAVALFAGTSVSQPPPASDSRVTTVRRDRSLSELPPGERFESVEGRFTIALPRFISGFTAISPSQSKINASGATYQWKLTEGIIAITFLDLLDPNLDLKSDRAFVNFFSGVRDSTLRSLNAKLLAETPVNFGEYRGYKFTFELQTGEKGSYRIFYVDRRSYAMLAVYSAVPNAEAQILKAFDGFALVTKSVSDAAIDRRVEAATPQLLPQEPRAPKEGTDAEDENLLGKVKTVVAESEDRSGTWGTQGRKMSSVENYNERGDLTKRIGYDSKGKPFQITVYGYLDGERASNSSQISYDDDPPLMALPAVRSDTSVTARDSRYEYKYAFKYVDRRLNEKQLILNNGEKGMRYVTTYDRDRSEELVYDDKGKLNMKFLYKRDDKGNAVERIFADVLGNRGADEVYRIRYDSFDQTGNWTKSTTSKQVKENGQLISKDWYVTYRTITYY